MIPKNLTREHILKAIKTIERNGTPKGRESTKFNLLYNGKYYPPKYVISLANKSANGIELPSGEFSGGTESNKFLINLGFQITDNTVNMAIKQDKEKVITTHHNQRCSECKNVIYDMFRKAYGIIKIDHKVNIPARLEDYSNNPSYKLLKDIYSTLIKYRGYKNFVKLQKLHRCDIFIPKPGFIVELDESQHFTKARYLSLKKYPSSLPLGFNLHKWINLCKKFDTKDNDPQYRDEQRAWYDTLRDFLPLIQGFNPTVRLYMGDIQWCRLSPDNSKDYKLFKSMITKLSVQPNAVIDSSQDNLKIATVIIQSKNKFSNQSRLKLLEKVLKNISDKIDVILLPAGFLETNKIASSLYSFAINKTKRLINLYSRNIIICLGIDGRDGKDQMGLAINANGLLALARKFHPSPDDSKSMLKAKSFLSTEHNKQRIFRVKKRKFYIAICYDGFGIKQKHLSNPGVEIILDLVHGFWPQGQGGSGDVYFAKHGFAGSSKQWNCPTFGSVVFFNRDIPENWPTGVIWDQGKKNTKEWKYKDNPLKPIKLTIVKEELEEAKVNIFNI